MDEALEAEIAAMRAENAKPRRMVEIVAESAEESGMAKVAAHMRAVLAQSSAGEVVDE